MEILSPIGQRGARTHIKPRGHLKTDVVNMNLASYLNPMSTITSESIGMIIGKIGFKHPNTCIFFTSYLSILSSILCLYLYFYITYSYLFSQNPLDFWHAKIEDLCLLRNELNPNINMVESLKEIA